MRDVFARSGRLLAAAICLAVLLAIGLSVYRDYGVSWDEPTQRTYGQTAWDYVLHHDRRLLQYEDRYYGPVYEMFLVGAERFARLKDTQDVYYLRHLCGFLLFCLGAGCFYRLCLIRFRDGRAALAGISLLCLSPHIFAHSLYNSKDVPFMSVFIIAIYTLLRFLERPTWSRAVLHAVTSAFLIDIRILGILVPVVAVGGLALNYSKSSDGRQRFRVVGAAGLYAAVTAGLVVLFWPTLWSDPLRQFAAAVKTMAHFPWKGDVLYMGTLWEASHLPWHYTLVWIAVSTPVVYLIGFLVGLPVALRGIWKSPARYTADERFDAVVIAWILLPLVAVFSLKSVVYDAWRHVFFIYPAMLLVALSGFKAIYGGLTARMRGLKPRLISVVLLAVLAAEAAGVLAFMVRNHPYQNVYFNWLVGGARGARYHFEMDYWGLSYRQGLERVLAGDDAEKIAIFVAEPPGSHNIGILPYSARRRLRLVDRPEDAKYFLGAYRSALGPYPYTSERWAVRVDGVSILSVFEMPGRTTLQEQAGPVQVTAPPQETESPRDATRQLGRAANSGRDSIAGTAGEVYTLIEEYLANYVHDPDELTLVLEPLSSEGIRKGHVENASVRIRGGKVGDFRHKGIGIPIREVDVSVMDLTLDTDRLHSGKLVLSNLGILRINRIILEAESVNAALAASPGKERNLSIELRNGCILARWAGRPRLEAEIRIWVAPDYIEPASDNLWFRVEKAKVAGLPLPARLVQWALEGYNPLIRPSKLRAILKAGEIVIDQDRLVLGTEASIP